MYHMYHRSVAVVVQVFISIFTRTISISSTISVRHAAPPPASTSSGKLMARFLEKQTEKQTRTVSKPFGSSGKRSSLLCEPSRTSSSTSSVYKFWARSLRACHKWKVDQRWQDWSWLALRACHKCKVDQRWQDWSWLVKGGSACCLASLMLLSKFNLVHNK